MSAPGVVMVILASHTLLSLAALCVCTVAAEVMKLRLKPLELNGCHVIGRPAGTLTE
jgi:hypothetical protein